MVPNTVVHGFLTALHLKFAHPSQNQLKAVFNRYFFALDLDKALGLVSANCHHCNALKSFPTELHEQTSEPPPDTIGVSYAADVLRRYKQCILLLRETVSSYTRTMIISDEKHHTIRDALMILISDFKQSNDRSVYIRVDPAPAFKALLNDIILQQHGIKLIMGSEKNVNKNPVAEKAIQEFGLECLKVCPTGGPMSPVTLAHATSTMNSRLRGSGLSAFEIWTQRDQITGSQLPISDRDIIQQQHNTRASNHLPSAISKSSGKLGLRYDLSVGDLVYLKSDKDKTKSRDKYIVVSIDNPSCKVRKFTATQFRAKAYDINISDCYPVTSTVLSSVGGPIRGLHQCDSDSSETSESEEESEGEVEPTQQDRIDDDTMAASERDNAEIVSVNEPEPPDAIVQPPHDRRNNDMLELPHRRSGRIHKPSDKSPNTEWVT